MTTSLTGQPPSGNVKEQLGTIFKQIREAQTLDGNGDEMGAYRHYLTSVGLTADVLSTDIQANQGQGTLPEQQVSLLYKMARECLERGEAIFTAAKKEQRPLALFRLATPSPTVSPTFPHLPFSSSSSSSSSQQQTHPSAQFQAPPTTVNSRNALPQGILPRQHSTPIQPATRLMTWPSTQGSKVSGTSSSARGVDSVDGNPGAGMGMDGGEEGGGDGRQKPEQYLSQPINTVRHMSYIDEAKLRNRHMMEQYKAHLRQQYSGKPVNNEAGLSMLRRLEENLSVARIREENIAKRLKEKEMKAKETGSKTKPAVVLSSLSVDELCDQVTSYEHGKASITAIKTHLNESNSDPSLVYSAVSEILSIMEHPLSRLLGEYQYSVHMLLQPVGAAVEKAGGLPQLDIRLDNKGLDRKPSIPPSSQDAAENDVDDDALLELLYDDDEDEGTPSPNLQNRSEDRYVQHPITLDDKLDRLKRELLSQQNGASEKAENEADSRTRNGEVVYENTKESDSHVYQELENAPMFDREDFDLEKNESYCTLPLPNHTQAPPTDSVPSDPSHAHPNVTESKAARSRAEMYVNLDNIAARVKEQEMTPDAHEYETLDNVFTEERGTEEGHEDDGEYEFPDGGLMSHPPPPPTDIELGELTVFRNLPPLVCSAHLGDEVAMNKLSATASYVLGDVVKKIHTSLKNLQQCFTSCYPILSSEENQEVCHTVLEASFFPGILSLLTIVYRCKNYPDEVTTAKNMCQHVNATPKDLSVRKKYWLLDQSHAPYGEAIDELRRVTSLRYPSHKLECLVRLSKRIIQCITDYNRNYNPQAQLGLVGVDDILPIMSYTILRSGLPQLISECSIMEEFIQEGYVMGEEGFCLTSFLTALRYIQHMSS